MTTKTSPGSTSNDTSRTAIVEPVRLRKSWLDSSVGGVLVLLSAGPKIFQRLRTEIVDVPADASRAGATRAAPGLVTDGSVAVVTARLLARGLRVERTVHHAAPARCHDRQPDRAQPPENQPLGPGFVFCQMCFASRYSSRPVGPSSRPMPDCLKPPHSACGR